MVRHVLLPIIVLAMTLVSPASAASPGPVPRSAPELARSLSGPAAAQTTPGPGCPNPAHDDEANHEAAYFIDAVYWAAQSFQVTQALQLGRVSLRIANLIPPNDDSITVEIRTGGPPPGTQLLASRTVVDTQVTYHWADFSFDNTPALSPGSDYFIVARGTGPTLGGYGWGADVTNPAYTGGQSYERIGDVPWRSRADADTMFRVWSTDCGRPVKVAIIADAGEANFADYVGADFRIVAPDGLGDAMMALKRIVDQGYSIHTLIFYGHGGTASTTATSPPRPIGAMQLGNRDYQAADFARLQTTFPNLAAAFAVGAQVQLLNCTLGQDTALVEAVARAYLRQGGGTVWAKDGDVGSFGTPTFWGLIDRYYFDVDRPEDPDFYFWTNLFTGSSGEWRAWYLSSETSGISFTGL